MRAKRSAVTGVLAASAIASVTLVRAGQQGVGQTPSQFPLSQPIRERGSSVTGAYEGWYRDKDGSIRLLVGYFNRNRKEDLDIPVGPSNRIEPGGPDQGQPTHFLPGRQWGVFTITVPKDFGAKKLTWTIVANGQTTVVPASLDPLWEVSPFVEASGNTPPTIRFEGGASVQGPRPISETFSTAVGNPLTLA